MRFQLSFFTSIVVLLCSETALATIRTSISPERWFAIGPFPVGKTEFDADPVEARGGVLSFFTALDNSTSSEKAKEGKRKKNTKKKSLNFPPIPSELSANGLVSGWTTLSFRRPPSQQSMPPIATLRWSNVNWQSIVQGMHSMEAASFQSWVIGVISPFSVGMESEEEGGDPFDHFHAECISVHSFFVAEAIWDELGELDIKATHAKAHLFAGDIYGSPHHNEGNNKNSGPNVVKLRRNRVHLIYFKLRGRTEEVDFSCYLIPRKRAMPRKGEGRKGGDDVDSAVLRPLKAKHVFDFWQGVPALGSNMIGLTCHNPSLNGKMAKLTGKQQNIFFTGTLSRGGRKPEDFVIPIHFDSTAHPSLSVFPGQTVLIPLNLSFPEGGSSRSGKASSWISQLDKDEENCAFLSLRVSTQLLSREDQKKEEISEVIKISFSCRRKRQSFVWTFIDHDGSPNHAAAIRYSNENSAVGVPILVTLSGVGVSARQAADSHKYMKKKGGKDFQFGLLNAWVLAPQREGAHNWEGQGMLACLTAIDAFSQRTNGSADGNRLLVDGHSRGGHGAWTLASKIPDRVLGLHVSSGWYNRQYYGDANTLFLHDLQLLHMDSHLKAVLEATILENDNGLHASNLCGLPILVRAGSEDYAVPPWMSRRMARHLQEVCRGHHFTFSSSISSHRANIGGSSTGSSLIRYRELPRKGHWWWDTETENDGGVMFDQEVRQFWASVLQRQQEMTEGEDKKVIKQEEKTSASKRQGEINADDDGSSSRSIVLLQFSIKALVPHAYRAGRLGFQIQRQMQRYQMSTISVTVIKKKRVIIETTDNNNDDGRKIQKEESEEEVRHHQCDTMGETPSVTEERSRSPCRSETALVRRRKKVIEVLKFEVTTENTQAFSLSSSSSKSTILLLLHSNLMEKNSIGIEWEIDGQSIQWLSTARLVSLSDIRDVFFVKFTKMKKKLVAGGIWTAETAQEEPTTFGSVRQVFDKPWKVVVGTKYHPSSVVISKKEEKEHYLTTQILWKEFALYICNHHFLAQDTLCEMTTDVNEIEERLKKEGKVAAEFNYVLLGGPDENQLTKMMRSDDDNNDQAESSSFSSQYLQLQHEGDSCIYDMQHHAAAYLLVPPLQKEKGNRKKKTSSVDGDSKRFMTSRLRSQHLVLHSQNLNLLRQLIYYTFTSDQALTRAAFTNMFPDLLVVDASFASQGYGGVVVAGWWKVDEENRTMKDVQGYFRYCRPAP